MMWEFIFSDIPPTLMLAEWLVLVWKLLASNPRSVVCSSFQSNLLSHLPVSIFGQDTKPRSACGSRTLHNGCSMLLRNHRNALAQFLNFFFVLMQYHLVKIMLSYFSNLFFSQSFVCRQSKESLLSTSQIQECPVILRILWIYLMSSLKWQ